MNYFSDLEDKVAIVTGGGKGLGLQMTKALCKAKMKVVICSRKINELEDQANQLSKDHNTKVIAMQCDISDKDSVDRVVNETWEKFGSIDVLVNNSGKTWGEAIETTPLKRAREVMETNFLGAFLINQSVGNKMIKQKSGSIINISSVASIKVMDPKIMDAPIYSVSKTSVDKLVKELAIRWGEYSIRVNAIAPGIFPTKMTKHMLDSKENYNEITDLTLLDRLGNESDLQGLLLLLSSEAGSYITGQVISVDGGMSLK